MRKWLVGGVALLAIGFTSDVNAEDVSVSAQLYNALPIRYWSWTGWYVGVHAGAAFGTSSVSDPYGVSIFGDDIRTPGFLLGGQLGYNWQVPGSNWVLGLEAQVNWLDAEGTNTCFAYSGQFTSSNCRARPDFTGTFTGRLGYAAGPAGRTLLYVKGGAAVLHNRIDATTNYGFGAFPITTTSTDVTTWGWTVGAGLEQAIAPAWSVKLEYDYLGIGDATLATATSFSTTPGGAVTAVPANSASMRQDVHEFVLGLNYRFGVDPVADWQNVPLNARSTMASDWSFEGGLRYWYSWGRFQKDLPSGSTSSASLISRLTYADLTAHSGELFGRLESPWDIFVKGNIGLGMIVGGHMNDEDWGLVTAAPFTGYSNTLSNLTDTDMNYGTIDLGFDFLVGPGYRVGGFVGYNHVHEQYAANDCTQIASPSSGICAPAITGVAVITETDNWDSLRVGLAAEIWLANQWKLTGDAAYLPYVSFSGVDNHWLRNLVIDESGHGRGVQLEALVSYYVTPQFSIGLGGRYWAMWTTSGSDAFNGVPIDRNDTYRYERYGLLAQAAYRF
jgi:opacity protein-like surface antigen/outer membrane protease